jgi:hypothetical protein
MDETFQDSRCGFETTLQVDLGQCPATRKTGKEAFCSDGKIRPELTVLQFWQWSVSDLVSNATRGRLAEFIIASALGIASDVRNEGAAFDLLTPAGLRIEVKSCAYLQSWKQTKLSKVTFSTRKSRAWNAETGLMEKESTRQSDLYIFALLAHRNSKKTLNPLDLDQWEFFLVPTEKIADRKRSQHSITLPSLKTLCPTTLHFDELLTAVRRWERELLPNGAASTSVMGPECTASPGFMDGVEDLPVQDREQ